MMYLRSSGALFYVYDEQVSNLQICVTIMCILRDKTVPVRHFDSHMKALLMFSQTAQVAKLQ